MKSTSSELLQQGVVSLLGMQCYKTVKQCTSVLTRLLGFLIHFMQSVELTKT